MYAKARILKAGDAALVVELGDEISPQVNRRIHDLVRVIDARPVPGVVDLVPTYRSLLVYYDPLQTTSDALEQELLAIEAGLGDAKRPSARVVEIPTVYGGEFGPDLGFVADHAKLTADEVIRIHSDADYLVYMMGFTAGFPYLGGMSARIAAPRLQTPRTRVPAGSVGIAQQQTGIYPTDSPGGWQLIGRSPIRIFDQHRDPPVVIEAGDYVRFVPVSEEIYRRVEREVQADTYALAIRMMR
jgi:inhibitor of KinA